MVFSQMESKNSKPHKEPDSSLATTSEELGLSGDNQELEQIAAAIQKEESTGEAEAKKSSKLSENNKPLNNEICKSNKDAELKKQTDSLQATTFKEELEPIVEESSLQGEAKMIFKVDETTIQNFNNKMCKLTKNAIPEERTEKNALGSTFAEFVLPEKNQELEKIVAAVEKGESTLEGGADKILKLAGKVCDIDKILSTLTEEICKRTKSNAVPVLMYMAISEGLQHIFNIGSGAAKLDFTAIRYLYTNP
jgi:hypothetical protein